MRKVILSTIVMFVTLCTNAQELKVKILPEDEVQQVFSESTKSLFSMNYPIFRVYEFISDKFKHYLVLTESADGTKGKENISKNIKGFIFKGFEGELNLEQEINDFIIPTQNEEYTMSFWTKYMSFEKIGSTVLPIVVYGTKAMNGYGDGRMKIVVLYKDKKIVIRHQNGTLDDERVTKIDKAFYSLPTSIQTAVKKKIADMEKAEHVLLCHNWKEQMQKQKLEIKE